MRVDLQRGRYHARQAASVADLEACQRLRARCFFGTDGLDADAFDAGWQHLIVEDGIGGPIVCTLRFQMCTGAQANAGYAAGFYDLQPFAQLVGPLLEIGRFCCDPGRLDPHILRVAWGSVTQIVDAAKAQMIFGCTSFAGTDPAPYQDVFSRLSAYHVGPAALRPGAKAGAGAQMPLGQSGEQAVAQSPMPPLLRTYLAMGGWVSDHAVIDPHMQTLHVLTAIDVARVPAARARALRALR